MHIWLVFSAKDITKYRNSRYRHLTPIGQMTVLTIHNEFQLVSSLRRSHKFERKKKSGALTCLGDWVCSAKYSNDYRVVWVHFLVRRWTRFKVHDYCQIPGSRYVTTTRWSKVKVRSSDPTANGTWYLVTYVTLQKSCSEFKGHVIRWDVTSFRIYGCLVLA